MSALTPEEIESRIRSAYADASAPDLDLPTVLSPHEEDCTWFVGKNWQLVIGELLDSLDCLSFFSENVFAYYVPAFAVEILKKGISPYSGAYDYLDRLVPRMVQGSPVGDAIVRGASREQRAALTEWFSWVHRQTSEYRDFESANLSLLINPA